MYIDCIIEPLNKQTDSSCKDERIGSLHADVNLGEGFRREGHMEFFRAG